MSRKLVQCEPSCSMWRDGRMERRTNMTKHFTFAFRTPWNTPSDISYYLKDKPLELVDNK